MSQLCVVGHLGELLQLLVAEEGGAHHCADQPVDGDVPLVHLVHEGVEYREALHPGDLDAVVGAIGERHVRCRKVVGVAFR
jgi:hypothetical protein